MSKRALIFGVTGQDGSYLAKFLFSKGYNVFGTSRDAQLSSFYNLYSLGIRENIHVLSANPVDFRSVLDAILRTEPDEIYNLAGQSSVGLSFDQPLDTFLGIGLANLTILEVIRFLKKNIKYYNAGSSDCFGNTLTPATECTPFHPRSPYAVAKSAAFWQVVNYREAYGLYACSGMLFNHESPLRPERFVTQKIVKSACRISSGTKEILYLGNLNIVRDWGWAPEYVEAMWQMLQQPEPEDYIIATGYSYTLQDFVAEVFSYLDLDWHQHVELSEQLFRPTDVVSSYARPKKACEKLQWKAKYNALSVARLLVEHELKKMQHNNPE